MVGGPSLLIVWATLFVAAAVMDGSYLAHAGPPTALDIKKAV